MKKNLSKHMYYYDFLESFSEGGCPVCNMTKKGIELYYDSLIYEYINDEGFRDRFKKENGFCSYHAHKFINYNDGLAVALPYRDLLARVINNLASSKPLDLNEECMVCDKEYQLQEEYLSIIVKYIQDEEFVTAFTKSDGLCIEHYLQAISMMKSPPVWFVDFHLQKYKKILSDLDRYIDSCNYSLKERRPILNREEKLIYKKLIKYLYKDIR